MTGTRPVSERSILRPILRPWIQEGEQLRHAALGVDRPPWGVESLFLLLGLIPLVPRIRLPTRRYAVGLTNLRLLIVRLSDDLRFVSLTPYGLDQLPPVRARPGPGTRIAIKDPQRPFFARFPRKVKGADDNGAQAAAIAMALVPGILRERPTRGWVTPLGDEMPLWLALLLILFVGWIVVLGLTGRAE